MRESLFSQNKTMHLYEIELQIWIHTSMTSYRIQKYKRIPYFLSFPARELWNNKYEYFEMKKFSDDRLKIKQIPSKIVVSDNF